MSTDTQTIALSGSRSRWLKDRLAQIGETSGGIIVLVALLLIFVYLLYVVKPIFDGARVEPGQQISLAGDGGQLLLGVEEQNELVYHFSEQGDIQFYSLPRQGERLQSVAVEGRVTAAAASDTRAMVAYGFEDRSIQ